MRYHVPVMHREARLISHNTALVSEIADGRVVRQDERDLRTFSDEQRYRLGVAAVTDGAIRL